jgi:hypothetical protein
VTVVQDDIRSLDPIATFADAVDNMIAINLLQEELLMMGQPYSDADLIIQHSNKMPNTENFRALKMEFIDCDVSQFSTSRPSLTHTQPNPSHLRIRKTWDEYCHRIQRFNASDPMNQPKSALSAKMQIEEVKVLAAGEVKALAASEEPLEAMMRRIISEYKAQAPAANRAYPSRSNHDRSNLGIERDAYKRGRNDERAARPPYQDRQTSQPSYQTRDRARQPYLPPTLTVPTRQPQRPNTGRGSGRSDPRAHQRSGTQGRFNPHPQERKAFGATGEENDDDDDFSDLAYPRVFSASAHSDHDNWYEDEGEDCYAMMGRRDYDFAALNDDEEDQA